VLGYGNGVDVRVGDVKAELWAGWLGRGRDGTAGGARRSAAELAVDEGGRNVALWRGNGASEASTRCVPSCGQRRG